MRVLYPARIGMGDVGICGGRKAGEAGEKPAEQGEQETQPTYGTGPDSNPGHIGPGEASALTSAPSLSPFLLVFASVVSRKQSKIREPPLKFRFTFFRLMIQNC